MNIPKIRAPIIIILSNEDVPNDVYLFKAIIFVAYALNDSDDSRVDPPKS